MDGKLQQERPLSSKIQFSRSVTHDIGEENTFTLFLKNINSPQCGDFDFIPPDKNHI